MIDQINKIYYTYLSKLKLMTMANHFIKETAYEMFCQEWKEYCKDINLVLNETLQHAFLIIPFNLVENIDEFPSILKPPKNDKEIFKSNVINYMSLHDLRYKVF